MIHLTTQCIRPRLMAELNMTTRPLSHACEYWRTPTRLGCTCTTFVGIHRPDTKNNLKDPSSLVFSNSSRGPAKASQPRHCGLMPSPKQHHERSAIAFNPANQKCSSTPTSKCKRIYGAKSGTKTLKHQYQTLLCSAQLDYADFQPLPPSTAENMSVEAYSKLLPPALGPFPITLTTSHSITIRQTWTSITLSLHRASLAINSVDPEDNKVLNE